MENQLLTALSNNKLLENIEISKIDLNDIQGEIITLQEGEILYKEEDKTEGIYLVVSGEINVLKRKNVEKTISNVFGPNEFFGEEEFLKEVDRETTAVAIADSYLIKLTKSEINKLIELDHGVAINLSINTPVDDSSYVEEFVDEKLVENILDEAIDESDTERIDVDMESVSIDDLTSEVSDEQNLDNEFSDTELDISESIAEKIGSIQENELEQTDNDDIDDLMEEKLIDAAKQMVEETHQTNEVSEKSTEELDVEDKTYSEENFEETEDFKMEDLSDVNEVENLLDDLETKDESEPSDDLVDHSQVKESLASENEFKTGAGGPDMSNEKFEMIIKAAQLVNSNIKVDDVLKNIVDVALDLTNADRGTLYLVNNEKNELWSKILTGEGIKEIRLKFGEGIAGWVAEKGETVNIEDAHSDPRFKGSVDKESGYETKSMLCFPIRNKREEIIGVLQLLNSMNGKFSEQDEWFLSALSNHAAIALENASLVERLLDAERESSLGKMGSFIGQDLKKPLLVSKRYAEHLSKKTLPKDAKQVVDMLLEQLNQVADLVMTTSSFTEGSFILRKEVQSINDLLFEYSNKIEPFLRAKDCTLVKELDRDAHIKVDSKELYQSFYHIIKNAVEALPEGGNIWLTTKHLGDKVTISIEDKGIGIEKENLEKVFEPLVSFNKPKSSGLGLSIAKKIIENHGGTILITSSPGEGTTVSVTLPVSS